MDTVKIVAQEPGLNKQAEVEIRPDYIIRISNNGMVYTVQAIEGGGISVCKEKGMLVYPTSRENVMIV